MTEWSSASDQESSPQLTTIKASTASFGLSLLCSLSNSANDNNHDKKIDLNYHFSNKNIQQQ